MRAALLVLSLLAISTAVFAQPSNDNCGGTIDLGVAPVCTDDIFTNVDASSSTGSGAIPDCFNGGSIARDVWFSFSTSDTLTDISLILQGVDSGPNGIAITNPQIAIYRGSCGSLSFLGICASASAGDNQVRLDVLGLTANTTYYVRVNDYTPSAAPNSGDFTLCIEEFFPIFNIGDTPSSSSCFGTLYDSGGPDSTYSDAENLTFTIAPGEFFQCIEITIADFQIEDGFDALNFFAGNSTSAPLIASLTGFNDGSPFVIQANSSEVTIQFSSDFSVVEEGFELSWQCSPLECDGSSADNPTAISGLPFNQDGYTTCEGAATFATSPCGGTPFLNGPEYVFAYETEGGFCALVQVTGASPGTGLLVLDGPPNEAGTNCLSSSSAGSAFGVDFSEAGTYYFVVANAQGCTDFGLRIEEGQCSLEPSLLAALCNPLNGCVDPSGLPSIFNFDQGFEDIEFNPGLNDGCWLGTGSAQPNYFWFTIEAQADGPFGFIVQAADPSEASDIDFNVWGPLDKEEVCAGPQSIVDFIENNQPLRSSWAGGTEPTGLAMFNAEGEPVTDPYDCDPVPGAVGGDDYASVIQAEEGQVFAVLINDWGNSIASGAISVDWSPSAFDLLAPTQANLANIDTAICRGASVQIELESSVENIEWLQDTTTLSCTDCLDPIATPTETTTYIGLVNAVCFVDTVKVLVQVFDVDAGPDRTVCRNEEFVIVAGEEYNNVAYSYSWSVSPANDGVILSCDDCPTPMVTAQNAGVYSLIVDLDVPNCSRSDTMELTVLPGTATAYNIASDLTICQGESANIGGAAIAGVNYSWSSVPAGPVANVANPLVMPDTTTVYFLSATNPNLCPLPSLDSVRVSVSIPPQLSIASDTTICQEEPMVMGNTLIEPSVAYSWQGPAVIENPQDPNSLLFPTSDATYTLTAIRGACTVTASFDVDIDPIAVEAVDSAGLGLPDTVLLCLGSQLPLYGAVTPLDSMANWSSTDPAFVTVSADSILVSPLQTQTYYLELGIGECFKIDSVVVVVDSLPVDLSIMPSDTSVCQGETVILESVAYEPGNFRNINFEWTPLLGQESPDSLYNLVLTGQQTTTYQRVSTSGACVQVDTARVEVIRVDQISITPADTLICAGEQVQLLAETETSFDSISWSSSNGEMLCSDCLDPIVMPGQTATYTVEISVESCPASAMARVQVQEQPLLGIVPQLEICLGDSIRLNTLFDENTLYEWSSTDPDFDQFFDPAPWVSPGEDQSYTVMADNGICEPITAEVMVSVIQPGELSLVVPDGPFCPGDTAVLRAAITGGQPGGQFLWEGSGIVLEGPELTVVADESTAFTFTYQSPSGCDMFQEEVFLEVEPVLNLALLGMPMPQDGAVPQGASVFIEASLSELIEDPVNLVWTLNGEQVASGEGLFNQDVLLIEEPSVVTVKATNLLTSCMETDSLIYNIELPLIDVPNAFTPNGDGNNDFFNIVTKGAFDEIVQFKVFNRWGQLVYDNDNPELGWDGSFNGNAQPSEVYMYLIQVRFFDGSTTEVKRGDVTLIR